MCAFSYMLLLVPPIDPVVLFTLMKKRAPLIDQQTIDYQNYALSAPWNTYHVSQKTVCVPGLFMEPIVGQLASRWTDERISGYDHSVPNHYLIRFSRKDLDQQVVNPYNYEIHSSKPFGSIPDVLQLKNLYQFPLGRDLRLTSAISWSFPNQESVQTTHSQTSAGPIHWTKSKDSRETTCRVSNI